MQDNDHGLPARAVLAPDSLHLELRDIGPDQLHDAFMQETIKRVPARASRIEIRKADLANAPSRTAPAGLIFHVARCGSTLASQLLKRDDRLVVYAEPLPFNELLVPPHKWDRAGLVAALRALGAAFARHARKPYVLKFTSWNTLFCDVVAEAFPSTPWALCLRDPVEVCVSLFERPPGWLRQAGGAMRVFANVIDPENASHAREDYVARVYAALCNAAAKLDTKHGAIVRYETLPGAVWNDLAPHFGLSVDEALMRRMSEASHGYSKAPIGKTIEFVPDGEKKRAAASPELRRAVEEIARPAFARLTARFGDR